MTCKKQVDLISIYKSLYKYFIYKEKDIWFALDASGLDFNLIIFF